MVFYPFQSQVLGNTSFLGGTGFLNYEDDYNIFKNIKLFSSSTSFLPEFVLFDFAYLFTLCFHSLHKQTQCRKATYTTDIALQIGRPGLDFR
jgi:hypothetical protein